MSKDNSASPAMFGGKPVRKTMLQYGRQWLDEDDIRSVVRVLKSDMITGGPTVQSFEQKVADYVGARYAVSFSSGTAALHGACFAAGIGLGDEVITTPLTFAATANSVRYLHGKVVFADVDDMTYNMDPISVANKITQRTKAIIPIHFAGQPVDLDAIHSLAKQYNLIVIEDAAHAFDASYKGRKIGALSDMTMFSFHPVKHITTGQGGMITTNRSDLFERLITFRQHGIKAMPSQERKGHGEWYYEMQSLGYNLQMTDIHAALGVSQLTKTKKFLEQRRAYAARYNEAFAEMPEITLPYQAPDRASSWHLYVIRLNRSLLKAGRKEIFTALRMENIGVMVHYIPVYYHPYYRWIGYPKNLCPKAEQLYEDILTLPLFPRMTIQDLEDSIAAVQKIIHYYSIESSS